MNAVRKRANPQALRENKAKANNTVNILYPYRTKQGTWVYDDEDLGVYSEAFVCGSSEVIDHLVGKETNFFTALISRNPIPGYQAKLIKTSPPVDYHTMDSQLEGEVQELVNGWYQLEGTDMKHWLCGEVLSYFSDYPDNIYVLIKDKRSNL